MARLTSEGVLVVVLVVLVLVVVVVLLLELLAGQSRRGA